MESAYVYNIYNGNIYECEIYVTESEKIDSLYRLQNIIKARNTMGDVLIRLDGDYREYTQRKLAGFAVATILSFYQRKYEQEV